MGRKVGLGHRNRFMMVEEFGSGHKKKCRFFVLGCTKIYVCIRHV